MVQRFIKIQNKEIKYSFEGKLNAKEIVAIENNIKQAYGLAQKSIKLIRDESSKEFLEPIRDKWRQTVKKQSHWN